jgi:hypothetical protein
MSTTAIAAEAAFPDETTAAAPVAVCATDLVRRYGKATRPSTHCAAGLSDKKVSRLRRERIGFVFQFRSLASCARGASLSPRRSRCFRTIHPKRRGPGASELRSAIGSAFTSASAMKIRSRGSACVSSSPVYA